jgi:hypothetical protein
MRTRLPDWARALLIVLGVPVALLGANGLIWATVAIDGNPSWVVPTVLLLSGLGAVVLGVWPSSRRGASLPRSGRAILIVGGLIVALFGVWLLPLVSLGEYGWPTIEANPEGGYSIYGPPSDSGAREPAVTGTMEDIHNWLRAKGDWQARNIYIMLAGGLVAVAAGAWPRRQRPTPETPTAEVPSSA